MVRVTEIKINDVTNEAKVSMFADTKEEVTSTMDIYGMPEGLGIEQGSSVLTASGDVAFYKSDNTWNWV